MPAESLPNHSVFANLNCCCAMCATNSIEGPEAMAKVGGSNNPLVDARSAARVEKNSRSGARSAERGCALGTLG